MKRFLCLFLSLMVIVSLCACEGNWQSVNLKDPIAIPKNGVIEETVIKQLTEENAIGIFTGSSGDFSYEWTIFGSDIETPRKINLGATISKTAEGDIQVELNQAAAFGFSPLLSIYLNETWTAQSATAFAGETAIASVSVTGSKHTILNLALDGTVREFIIRADPLPEDEPAPSISTEETLPSVEKADDYLSKPTGSDDSVYTGGKDKYNTDPVPPGKPQPVEPENQNINTAKTYTCTFSIECSTILNNLDMLDETKLELVPSNGVIFAEATVTFYEGESVFDVLQRLCKEKGIHMEAAWTPIYNSAYVEGIHNLYEFDCGALSGWMYKVNGWYPNYGSSRYQLKDGDVVQWRYTCDLGNDVGGGYAVGG